jgi:hypothetical protein
MRNRALSPRDCAHLGLRYQRPAPVGGATVKNGCALDAVRKAWELFRKDVPCKILHVENGGGGHATLIFEAPDGTIFSFDGGSLRLKGVNKTSEALTVARAYLKAISRGRQLNDVTKAVWLTE